MNELDTYLAHHGIKGQKWGVRRYQNADGSLTAEGRKRAGLGPEKKESSVKKMVDRAKARSAQKKAATEAEKHENLKNYIRNHPKKMYKYRNELSENDVKDIVSKIEFDRKLKDVRDEEIKRGWAKVKRFSDNMGTVKSLMQNGKEIYNLAVEVNNTLIDSGALVGKKKLAIGGKKEDDRSWATTLIRNGTDADILKNASKLTTQELSDYYKRTTVTDNVKKRINGK